MLTARKKKIEKKAWVKRGLLYMEAGLGSVTVRDSEDCHQTVGKPKSLSKVLKYHTARRECEMEREMKINHKCSCC